MRTISTPLVVLVAACAAPMGGVPDTADTDPAEGLALSSVEAIAEFDGQRLHLMLGHGRVGLGLDAIERATPDRRQLLGGPAEVVDPDRVRIAHDGIDERWEAVPEGFAHSFVVHHPVSGAGPLRLRVAVDGATPHLDPDDRDRVWLDVPDSSEDGEYYGLKAWDADGSVLSSRFAIDGTSIILEVDDTGAQYPITVDPIATVDSGWSFTGAQAMGMVGRSVAVGNFNDDAYDDLAVGEPCFGTVTTCPSVTSAPGRIHVFYGSASGLPSVPDWSWTDGTGATSYPASAGTSTLVLRSLGISLAALDLDGDGIDDLAAGAHRSYPSTSTNTSMRGALLVFKGAPAGLGTGAKVRMSTAPASNHRFGERLVDLGDVNGDGKDDLFVGAQFGHHAAVLFGAPAATALDGTEWAAPWTVTGTGNFGDTAVSLDFDCDNDLDLAVAAPNQDAYPADTNGNSGQVYLYANPGPTGVYSPTATHILAPETLSLGTKQWSVATAADVDADGCDDLIMQFYAADRAEVVYGGATAPFRRLSFATGGTGGDDYTGNIPQPYHGSRAGDVNADGFDDVLLRQGRSLRLYWGSERGLEPIHATTTTLAGPFASDVAGRFSSSADRLMPLGIYEEGPTGAKVTIGRVILHKFTADYDYDGINDLTDCNDRDAYVHPGATERCDGVDNDCDGSTDEGLVLVAHYPDDDGDGYGKLGASLAQRCIRVETRPEAWSTNDDDCDDTDADVHPGATEVCNFVDDDCDTATDEGEGVQTRHYEDDDADGYGNPDLARSTLACATPPPGYVANPLDCNDSTDAIHPAAEEVCNGVNDDCDDATDEGVKNTYYADTDGDGYGKLASPTLACTLPSGYAATPGDCNDNSSAIRPNATEVCDAENVDENCNGSADDLDLLTPATGKNVYFLDDDGDLFGRPDVSTLPRCEAPAGHVLDATDCDDASPTDKPGATETFGNGDDEDCDGKERCYVDADGDGYRTETSALSADWTCPIAAHLALAGAPLDCNDAQPLAFPGATEVPYNAIDEDCTDGDRVDVDNDGAVATVVGGADCNDANPNIRPGQPELDNGIDDDCDGIVDDGTLGYDDDGDGITELDGDCDDSEPSVPTPEVCNERDDNCNGIVDETTDCFDDDGDGKTEEQGDCNDANASIKPNADERRNGVDDDCDGTVDEGYLDLDLDGFTAAQGDCDDDDDALYPGAAELADGLDQDCDGTIDEGTTAYDDDADGYAESEGDCDDTTAYAAPNMPEIEDLLDNDCDGEIDEADTRAPDDDAPPPPEPRRGCDHRGRTAPSSAALLLVGAALLRRKRLLSTVTE